MNQREHAVLSLFYDEGNSEVTPSLLAYRMRMSTDDATKMLDGMVKRGALDLHIDEEGHISYRLPPSERHRIDRRPPSRQPDHRRTDGGRSKPDRSRSGSEIRDGTDANVGRDDHRRHATSGATRQHGGPAGTDGSLEPRHTASTAPRRVDSAADVESPPQQDPYEEWYDSEPGAFRYETADEPTHTGTRRRTATAERGGRRGAPTARPDSLPAQHHPPTPAHRSAGVPADSEGPHSASRHRIPVLAGALSLLVPGLGQFYNGELGKGVMVLFSYLFLWVFWLFWVVHIWSVIDAYMVAEQSNQRKLLDDHDNSQQPLLPERHPRGSNPNSNAA